MPVVVSMLNSYSAGGAGIASRWRIGAHHHPARCGLIGAILSYIMCKGMTDPSLVIAGGSAARRRPCGTAETRPVKQGSAKTRLHHEECRLGHHRARYGMAVAQAQHAVREMAEKLKREGVKSVYAIHPVAGRMPGHMNVLLAEANVPMTSVELDDINSQFAQTDVAYVIGANRRDNPALRTIRNRRSMACRSSTSKRRKPCCSSNAHGFGLCRIENELFFRDNTMMLFADAKKMTEEIVKALG